MPDRSSSYVAKRHIRPTSDWSLSVWVSPCCRTGPPSVFTIQVFATGPCRAPPLSQGGFAVAAQLGARTACRGLRKAFSACAVRPLVLHPAALRGAQESSEASEKCSDCNLKQGLYDVARQILASSVVTTGLRNNEGVSSITLKNCLVVLAFLSNIKTKLC